MHRIWLLVALGVVALVCTSGIQGSSQQPTAESGSVPTRALKGRWTVEFTNRVIEVCEFHQNGAASVVEPTRSAEGIVTGSQGSFRIDYRDGRIERWSPIGKRMIVEHWPSSTEFPTGSPVLGIAELHRDH